MAKGFFSWAPNRRATRQSLQSPSAGSLFLLMENNFAFTITVLINQFKHHCIDRRLEAGRCACDWRPQCICNINVLVDRSVSWRGRDGSFYWIGEKRKTAISTIEEPSFDWPLWILFGAWTIDWIIYDCIDVRPASVSAPTNNRYSKSSCNIFCHNLLILFPLKGGLRFADSTVYTRESW